ncbi:MAG: hypothetical protein ACPG4T_20325 [Nannocystaceae bacterium]
MAHLIHIDPAILGRAAANMEMPPTAVGEWMARRPSGPLGPWFELSPASPAIDGRLEDGPGVTAALECFGGVSGLLPGPLRRLPSLGAAVLGGHPVMPGSPAEHDVSKFRRQLRAQCSIRLRVAASGLVPGRQMLLLICLYAHRAPVVQTFVGTTQVDEAALSPGDARYGILMELDDRGGRVCELWLRLAGRSVATHLGVYGVQGFLL